MSDRLTVWDVHFKSIPEMYEKEKDGRKPNTLRRIDENDPRFEALRADAANTIAIVNDENGESFVREITDYTEWGGWAVISWNHVADPVCVRCKEPTNGEYKVSLNGTTQNVCYSCGVETWRFLKGGVS